MLLKTAWDDKHVRTDIFLKTASAVIGTVTQSVRHDYTLVLNHTVVLKLVLIR